MTPKPLAPTLVTLGVDASALPETHHRPDGAPGARTAGAPLRVGAEPLAAAAARAGVSLRALLVTTVGVVLARGGREGSIALAVDGGSLRFAWEPTTPLGNLALATERARAAGGSPTARERAPLELRIGEEPSSAGKTLVLALDAERAVVPERALPALGNALAAALADVPRVLSLAAAELALVGADFPAKLAQVGADDRASTGTSLATLFERACDRAPDHVAVLGRDARWTYAELDRQANRIAAVLLRRGVKPGDRVAMVFERSPAAVATVLAIVKARAVYVPIEPTYPAERIAFLVADAGAKVLVTTRPLEARVPPAARANVDVVRVDDPSLDAETSARPAISGGPGVAYVMYTSGSTGQPKGAEIPERAIERLVCDVDYVRLGPSVTFLAAAPLAFDASTLELWGPLLSGGTVALYEDPVPTAAGLRAAIARTGATTMWLTAALFNAVVDEDPTALASLRQIFTGGEALSVAHVRRAAAALPQTELHNGYGPTETTTFATTYRIPRDLPEDATHVPIGRAIRGTRLRVLDDRMQPLPFGFVGELHIGGEGLARGYLGRPELTRERFVDDPWLPGQRLYKTGDLVRMNEDGVVEYVGRADGQVKIRGFRIELGEIEARLAEHAGVRRAVVVARTSASGDKRLVAYVVAEGAAPKATALREHLAPRVPDYMVPSAFVFVAEIPVTGNGKVDVRALPAPDAKRPELAVPYAAPTTKLERILCAAFAAALELDEVGVDDGFFDLGGSSLLAVRVAAALRREHALDVPVIRLFEHPTAAGLARTIEGAGRAARPRAHPKASRDGIAIVGMAGKFPGARSVEALWENLVRGLDTIRKFTDAELDASIPDAVRRDPRYVAARGVLDDVELFDAGFFGIAPREAELLDPQQRLLMEVAWEALEDAGHVPSTFPGTIGVFAGKYNDSYYAENVVGRPDLVAELGTFQTMVGTEKDYVATRIAHKLDLTGPALSIHTACSTSLVAIAQAFFALQSGQCDLALAGGASITVPVKSGYVYQEGAMLSDDGHTRSFDARAAGTTFSDGVAMVVLRRLEDALRDGDVIYGVLRGAAINNDGADKASFTAPSAAGQAAVISAAREVAGVDARQIGYVEAHGTATPLGDPIEVEGLTRSFRESTDATQFCALGSVKSNVGHLVIAAGATGMIKAALALTRELIPKTAHFERANPAIDFATSPFFVVAENRPWPRTATARFAGVSSFGVGGTNAHVIVEEPPALPTRAAPPTAPALLLLSARSEAALGAASNALAEARFADDPHVLHDLAATLAHGRKAFSQRRAVVANDLAEARAALRDPNAGVRGRATANDRPVVFLFPGQGAQYAAMGAGLYRADADFRRTFDAVAEALAPASVLGFDLRRALFDEPDAEKAAAALKQTSLTQPALFAIELAIARWLGSRGVAPSAMIGHSVGEFVAAAMAGVMTDEDAARLVAERGRLMQSMPPGAMLSVRLASSDVTERLKAFGDPSLAIASDNGPALSVVAGPSDAVARLEAELVATGVVCRPLVTSHAFHSPMMDPAVGPFTERVRRVTLRAPRIPFVSTRTGTWITDAQATDPDYWGAHLRDTVRYAAAVKTLVAELDPVLVEAGPRATLLTLARQQKKLAGFAALGDDPAREHATALLALGGVFASGGRIDLARAVPTEGRRRLRAPTYPFERKRFWVERAAHPAPQAPPPVFSASAPVAPPPAPEATTMRKDRLLADLVTALEEASGVDAAELSPTATFLELGLDSLFLTQFALAVQKKFGVKVTFRELVEKLPSLDALAGFLDAALPKEASAPAAAAAPPAAAMQAPVAAAMPSPMAMAMPATAFAPIAVDGSVRGLIEAQLRIMQQQLAVLGAAPAAAAPVALAAAAPAPAPMPMAAPPAPAAAPRPAGEPEGGPQKYDVKKAFGAIARITTTTDRDMTPAQRARYDAFVRRYTAKTKASKAQTQENRKVLADPRVVTGFRPPVKELVYQVVIERSLGSHIWDLDGNEYVDVLNGFGCNLFGWQPKFVTEAVKQQLDRGHEIGPQHPLAAECAKLVCKFTGFDRAAFCNTGSEAVMGCMRVARTHTGRSKIALFAGSYHGIFDEVIVRGTKKLKSIPAAPGIMPESAQNVVVLDYGTPEALAWIRENANDLAAVLVEPIQSRRPDFRPKEFLQEVRAITEKSGTVLIFDEVICGFRMGPGGAQEYYGIKADIASYGKVVGGGLPVGVIAGKRDLMDALDGGYWQFGDDSVPTVGVTYFAGTFVRHPLALAAVRAVLRHLESEGPALWRNVNGRTDRLANELNAFFREVGAPLEIRWFSSLWKTFHLEDHPFQDLLYPMIRDRGVHIIEGFPCFLTTAHTDADVDFIVAAYKAAVLEMQDSGFFPARKAPSTDPDAPPVPGARLGRDPAGNPAWFVENPDAPGKYLKVEVNGSARAR